MSDILQLVGLEELSRRISQMNTDKLRDALEFYFSKWLFLICVYLKTSGFILPDRQAKSISDIKDYRLRLRENHTPCGISRTDSFRFPSIFEKSDLS
jgi:hypothetical protein